MAPILEWTGPGRERAEGPDGIIYVLASENMNGAHGGRVWEVFVYEDPGQPVTRILKGDHAMRKADARRDAERDARARAAL